MAVYRTPNSTRFFYGRTPRIPVDLFVVKRHGTIVGVLLTAILLLTTLRVAPVWTWSWILVYWLGKASRRRTVTSPWLSQQFSREFVQRTTAVCLVGLVTAFVGYTYHRTRYLSSGLDDTLWLLFALPPLAAAQLGHWRLLAGASILATVVVSATVPGISRSPALWFAGPLTRGLWVFLLSLASHTLLRIVGDRGARFHLLHGILSQVTGLRTSSSRSSTLAALVTSVAEAFGYDQVAVYLVDPSGSVTVAIASPLCAQGALTCEHLPDDHGIPERVAITRSRYVANNVASDDVYQPNTLLPDAASELAVPIFQGDVVVGVLDVRNKRADKFIDQDAEACEMLAARIATILDNHSLLQSRQRLSDISASLTERFSKDSVDHALHDIATAALDELRADVVMLYEHDPSNGAVRFAGSAGTLGAPASIDTTKRRQPSMVEHRLAGEPFVFEELVHALPGGFAVREQVRSRASVHLVVGQQLLGLMFLNYRRTHLFDDDEREAIRRFAHLAALALQRRHTAQHLLARQRDEFIVTLHDSIASKVTAAGWLLALGREGGEAGSQHLERAAAALEMISKDVAQIVRFQDNSESELAETTLSSLVDDLRVLHRVDICVLKPVPWLRWTALEVTHLKSIVEEAVFNATKAGASVVTLGVCELQGECRVTISDDGPGFDAASVERGCGLANMERRALWLGGTLSVRPNSARGTVIQVSFAQREELEG